MFTNFHIERFRGIPSLDIDGVKPINLIVGKNNSGKTSVLEAIFLLCGATDPINTVKVANLRLDNGSQPRRRLISHGNLFFVRCATRK